MYLTITKADKSKAIVIINKNNQEEKVDKFIQENHIKQINKDPPQIDTKSKSNKQSKNVTY